MRGTLLVLASASVLGGTFVLAQSLRTAPRVPRAMAAESLDPTPVGGATDLTGSVYGLMANSPATKVNFPFPASAGDPALYIRGVGPGQNQLCVSIKRAQGGYKAGVFVVQIPGGRGAVRVPFDSSPAVRQFMRAQQPSALELAVRVTEPQVGQCRTRAPMLAASWSAANPTNWALMVGAGNIGKPWIRVNGAPRQSCVKLSDVLGKPGMRAGNYSHACPVSFGAGACAASVPAQVLWMDGERLVGEARLDLRPPCGEAASG